MPRYIAETHAPEATGSIKARVIDTHDADTIVAWTQTTERAESIAALLNDAEQRAKAKRQREARAYRKYLEREGLDTPDDTPSLANCDDWGTGEGRYHGRM